jgi:hypothetical protein
LTFQSPDIPNQNIREMFIRSNLRYRTSFLPGKSQTNSINFWIGDEYCSNGMFLD